MSRLAGLEDQLANKQEQEHSLRDQITNLQVRKALRALQNVLHKMLT